MVTRWGRCPSGKIKEALSGKGANSNCCAEGPVLGVTFRPNSGDFFADHTILVDDCWALLLEAVQGPTSVFFLAFLSWDGSDLVFETIPTTGSVISFRATWTGQVFASGLTRHLFTTGHCTHSTLGPMTPLITGGPTYADAFQPGMVRPAGFMATKRFKVTGVDFGGGPIDVFAPFFTPPHALRWREWDGWEVGPTGNGVGTMDPWVGAAGSSNLLLSTLQAQVQGASGLGDARSIPVTSQLQGMFTRTSWPSSAFTQLAGTPTFTFTSLDVVDL